MIQYELEAITEAAIELVKDQPYAIKCEYDEELKKCVVKEWGEGVTPPSDSDLDAKKAEKLAQREISKIKGPLFHRKDIGTSRLIQKKINHMDSLR